MFYIYIYIICVSRTSGGMIYKPCSVANCLPFNLQLNCTELIRLRRNNCRVCKWCLSLLIYNWTEQGLQVLPLFPNLQLNWTRFASGAALSEFTTELNWTGFASGAKISRLYERRIYIWREGPRPYGGGSRACASLILFFWFFFTVLVSLLSLPAATDSDVSSKTIVFFVFLYFFGLIVLISF